MFEELLGKTLIRIDGLEKDSDSVGFYSNDGNVWSWSSSDGFPNDCNVFISTISGDVQDLLNSEILKAETRTNQDENLDPEWTWTFFTIETKKGFVDITWQGSSNGYYSEEPTFYNHKSDYGC